MDEIAPGIWRWTARHPQWGTRIEWGRKVASFALVGDGALWLVDPLLPAPESTKRAEIDRALERLAREAARLDIMITIPYHTRSAEELLARYRDAATTLTEIVPGRPFAEGVLALAIGKPRRLETPLFFSAQRALAFGDAVIGIDGGLRVWQQSPADPVWYERRFIPTLRPLLDLDVERALVTHGPPVLCGGRKALEAALAAGPWDYRALKD
jgi:hypothetical protein